MYDQWYYTTFEEDEYSAYPEPCESPPVSVNNLEHTTTAAATTKPRIGYVHSAEHLFECERLPRIRRRCLLVHGLIKCYGLLKSLYIIRPPQATRNDLLTFHSEDYVDFLETCESAKDLETTDILDKAIEYNLMDDCPLTDRIFTLVKHIAGGTLSAARALTEGQCDVAIHWEGGWHHAQRSEAAGFCYVNDVVLGILQLRRRFERVLYVDLDVHHGDGVQDAFCGTDKVATVSFHQYEPCFYPGTGDCKDVGIGRGRGYSVNVPLRSGMRDPTFVSVVTTVLAEVQRRYDPVAVVCQCGADCLSGDPLGAFNLTADALSKCLSFVQAWKLPLLVLGGGGYSFANVARCWTKLTATLLGVNLDEEIPEHGFLMEYGPGYELGVEPGRRPDLNDSDYVDGVVRAVLSQVRHMDPP
ncbi:histone deacetylase complex, catalytic component HDA1, putative [Ixodes scapularis]|uniref:Histone deacetylase n=1 Tax=Ixodes scapularis TaxID=6945 RepID=B7PS10_IXOSC|nr:histone deacetylase complex, catalytic component HDA1, putative [Ixodes scapularis]|eukprot:XP_002401662.1 histone deacetylase complex, catalytic component HDA1, putative [Ixodes scapularis]